MPAGTRKTGCLLRQARYPSADRSGAAWARKSMERWFQVAAFAPNIAEAPEPRRQAAAADTPFACHRRGGGCSASLQHLMRSYPPPLRRCCICRGKGTRRVAEEPRWISANTARCCNADRADAGPPQTRTTSRSRACRCPASRPGSALPDRGIRNSGHSSPPSFRHNAALQQRWRGDKPARQPYKARKSRPF